MRVRFELGSIYATNGVNNKIEVDDEFAKFVSKSFARHCNGDWGDLDEDDKAMNDRALKFNDDRLFSKYEYDGETSIYIITEWDRSATTILFPSEY